MARRRSMPLSNRRRARLELLVRTVAPGDRRQPHCCLPARSDTRRGARAFFVGGREESDAGSSRPSNPLRVTDSRTYLGTQTGTPALGG
ncbi:hypothetical protein C9J85_05615 [Haloferax sp. wsp5]|nr:hypothetical protein C9J85_05615 [Haloferax sp. wsp5]